MRNTTPSGYAEICATGGSIVKTATDTLNRQDACLCVEMCLFSTYMPSKEKFFYRFTAVSENSTRGVESLL